MICLLFLFLLQCRFRFDLANGMHSALKERKSLLFYFFFLFRLIATLCLDVWI
jgi:hypothetical protein